MTFPNPQLGAGGQIVLNGIPLRLAEDPATGDIAQYEENDPARFADKISIGDLKYGDFNPYENAFAVGQFDGGYGLDRYQNLSNEQDGIGIVKESFGVDTRFGMAFLSGLVGVETLPSAAATPVWVGEFTPSTGAVSGARWVAIAGTKVWYRNSNATWTDTGLTLAAAAVQGAVTVVGGQLIIGYGAGATAQFITALDGTSLANVTNTTPTAIYVFAATTDRAAVYIAGGTASTNSNQVLSAAVTAASPAVAFGLAGSAVTCGGTDRPITGLAPGGAATVGGNGQALVFVANQKELGVIAEVTIAAGATPVAIYMAMLPFDTNLATNGQGLKWAQGTSSEEQRGPATLYFGRDRSPWTYTPTQAAARNIAPWAKHGFRPPTIRGRATCFQGTARYVYYAITRGDGHSWVLADDTSPNRSALQTDPTCPLFDLGVNACRTLGITSLFGTNPLLFFGYGNGIASVILPLDGECPLDDTAVTFGASGTMTMPDIDHGFPDEDKVEFSVRLVHDKVSPGAQDITVNASLDGGAFTQLGKAGSGSSSSVGFVSSTVSKRVTLQFVLSTTSPSATPILFAFSVRASINPLLYKEWIVQASPQFPQTQPYGGMDLQNLYTLKEGFFTARKNGTPVPFIDIWQDNYVVRILRFSVKYLRLPSKQPPEAVFFFDLLYVSAGAGSVVYGGSLATYGAVTSKYG